MQRQLDLALASGAERILLLADTGTQESETLLQTARTRGVGAKRVADAPALCASVTSADEILLIADCLLPDPEVALPLFEKGSMVATLPIEPALSHGFERLDADRAWAGLLSMPGSLCERLRQLPRDCDVASSLLRIALMAGVATRQVDARHLVEHRWQLVKSAADAQAVETARLGRILEETRGHTPGPRLAAMAIGRFGSRSATPGRPPEIAWYASAAVLCAAAAVTAFLSATGGLLLFAMAWVIGRGARVLGLLEEQGRAGRSPGGMAGRYFDAGFDILLAIAVGGALAAGQWGDIAAWHLPFVLVAVFTLARNQGEPAAMRVWLADRFLLCILLAGCAFAGLLGPGIMAISAAVLASWLIHSRPTTKKG